MSDTETGLPNHLGIILDGNRRWAKKQGLPTLEGHRQGMEALKDVSLHAFDAGIQYISAYIFSTENWKRTEEEVAFLMGLVLKAVEKHLDTFHEAGIRLRMLGSRDGLDKKILAAIDRSEQKTKDNTRGTLALCFNYGGQQEIVDAVKQVVAKGNEISVDSITENLYEADIPPLDFVIRTSGEQRLSGFMLWRASYAELYFTDTFWPAFTPELLDEALNEYAKRNRRFGG